jgi:hypothetical protein
MSTIDQVYRDNLRLLIKEAGTQDALAAKIGKSAAQLSQWVNASKDSKTGKPRVLSRQMARHIEKKMGKPDGWMDRPHELAAIGPARGAIFDHLTDDEREMLYNFRSITDKDRARLAREMAERAEELRVFLAQVAPQAIAGPGQAEARAAGAARATVKTAQRPLFDEKTKDEEHK